MPKIKVLPKETIEKICAGEVIEGPSSVIKELIENSFDANSTEIVIEVNNGGKDSIIITDNGNGISKDDLKLSLEKHTSSKIYNFDDLLKLSSLGFRGEALSSISSVSKLTILSKTNDSKVGNKIVSDFGKISQVLPEPYNIGTKIIVENIFSDIPARLKFLGSDISEFRKITKILIPLVLSHPEVKVKIIHNSKIYLDLPNQTYKERFIEVYKFRDDIFTEINSSENNYEIRGIINLPHLPQQKNKLLTYINGRYINSPLINTAIKKAFHRLQPEGNMPTGILFLKVPTQQIDVNIHPKKLDIAFEYPKKIFQFIYYSISKNLEKEFFKVAPNINPKFDDSSDFIKPDFSKYRDVSSFNNESQNNLFSYDEESNAQLNNFIEPLGQIFDCYIIAKTKDGLKLYDQHAVHEKILYDKFYKAYKNNTIAKQNLLTPEIIELDKEKISTFEEISDFINSLGFEAEILGTDQIVIRSIPIFLSKMNLIKYFNEILDKFEKNYLEDLVQEKHFEEYEKKIAYMSCRSAIKANRKLSIIEQAELLQQVQSLEKGYTCPHGRPISVSINEYDLEKMFHRK